MSTAFLIPCYEPASDLAIKVAELRSQTDAVICIVNDGSGARYNHIFDDCMLVKEVFLVTHFLNQGKGAALKSGFNFLLNKIDGLDGVVCFDADGQHLNSDVLKIYDVFRVNPSNIILGYRVLGKEVPFRSRLGNYITRIVFQLLIGLKLNDTQTGLRAIPREMMIRSLSIGSVGYDFETEQLMIANQCKVGIREHEISAVYLDNNSASNFNPIIDSAKIYFQLIRYSVSSLLTAIFEFLVFAFIISSFSFGVVSSTLISRCCATLLQYRLSIIYVFNTEGRFLNFCGFGIYVGLLGFVSGLLQERLVGLWGADIFVTKIMVESLLFIFNFLFLRSFIFKGWMRQ